MPKITPYPYQSQGIDKLFQGYSAGLQSILMQSPTGSGKTVIASEVIRQWIAKHSNPKVYFFVHSDLLFESTMRALSGILDDLPTGTINAIRGTSIRPSAKIFVSTYQLFSSRWKRQNYKAFFDEDVDLLAIFDETHLTFCDKIGMYMRETGRGKILGLSATPKRAKTTKVKLHQLYQHKIVVTTPATLVADKKLAPLNVVLPPDHVNFANLESIPQSSKFGEQDYKAGALSSYMSEKKEIYSGFEKLYQKYDRPKTIVFCVDINHVMDTFEELERNGIDAKFLTSEPSTPKSGDLLFEQKQKKVDRWKAHKQARNTGAKDWLINRWGKDFNVLVSASMMTTGVDVPDIIAAAIMRPTMSENLYLQMVGRATRYLNGKTAMLWDLSGCVERHGHPYLERDYPLVDKRKKKASNGESPTKMCPQCGQSIPASAKVCASFRMGIMGGIDGICGYVFPEMKRVPVDTDYTVVEWDAICTQRPSQIKSKPLTPVGVYEYYKQFNENTTGRKISYAWVYHKVHTDFGRDGLISLALHKGIPPSRILESVRQVTDIDV